MLEHVYAFIFQFTEFNDSLKQIGPWLFGVDGTKITRLVGKCLLDFDIFLRSKASDMFLNPNIFISGV